MYANFVKRFKNIKSGKEESAGTAGGSYKNAVIDTTPTGESNSSTTARMDEISLI
jgi:hypothetical protein